MITVYGGFPTRSFRVIWLLEELGLPYQVRAVDLRQRQADADFMAHNPAGFMPAIDDDGVAMVDSIAITEYILARYGNGKLAPAPADANFPTYQQFLHLGESGLAAYLNVVVAMRFMTPEAERATVNTRGVEYLFFNRLSLVTRQLAQTPMIAGKDFTAADISVEYALGMAERLGYGDKLGPEIKAYRERLSVRPAYKAALAKWAPPAPG
jgi:glutathione S-transferase